MDENLLAPCGHYCGSCVVFAKGKCLGCREEGKKRAAEGIEFCKVHECATKRGIACHECPGMPCDRYGDSIYNSSFIDWIREQLQKTA
jgi:hypothetical protein